MITHLLIIMCLSADDCQVHRHVSFEGPKGPLACELMREAIIEEHPNLRTVRLQCEVEYE